MSKDVINFHGEDVVVREDVAKRFRGVKWALISIGSFILITALLFFVFGIASVLDGPTEGRDGSVPANTK